MRRIILFAVLTLVISQAANGQYRRYSYYDQYYQQQQGNCDNTACSNQCYQQGLHGECDFNTDQCRCGPPCVYRGCRNYCRRLRGTPFAQCDDGACRCL